MNGRVQVFARGAQRPRLVVGSRGLFVGQLVRPKGVATDSAGNIYVVESYYDHLLVFDREGRFLLPIGGLGRDAGHSTFPPDCGSTSATASSWPTCSTGASWCCSSWGGKPMASPSLERVLLGLAAAASLLAATAFALRAAGISDVRNTKHNLSVSGAGPVRSTTESQVCVFCHTPHGATPGVAPIWNRALGTTTYTPYTSSSLDAQAIQGASTSPGAARSSACRATTARWPSAT